MNAITFEGDMIAAGVPVRVYNIDVTEIIGAVGEPQSRGRFKATCRETGAEMISTNAEHDAAHAISKAGWPDGPVNFWRGSTLSLSHPSVHRMGRFRIALGEQFPQRVKRKDGRPEISSESVAGSVRNRETRTGGIQAHGEGARP